MTNYDFDYLDKLHDSLKEELEETKLQLAKAELMFEKVRKVLGLSEEEMRRLVAGGE